MGRVVKGVWSLDSDRPIECNWDDCTRYGTTLHRVVQHLHPRAMACSDPRAEHRTHIFCSGRHLGMWTESTGWRANRLAEQHGGRIYGMLPTGSRGSTG